MQRMLIRNILVINSLRICSSEQMVKKPLPLIAFDSIEWIRSRVVGRDFLTIARDSSRYCLSVTHLYPPIDGGWRKPDFRFRVKLREEGGCLRQAIEEAVAELRQFDAGVKPRSIDYATI